MSYQFDFSPLLTYWPELAAGIVQTLRISCIAMVAGLVLGIALTALRMSPSRPLRWLAVSYIELVRNTPFLVQIFFIFFGLPALGLRFDATQAAVLAMSLNCSAYAAEIVRGGVQAVPKGQVEAGRALGLGTADIYRFIVFRPAIRAIYPSLCSQFVLLMLNSSLVAAISAEELTYAAQMIDNRTFRSFEIFAVVGLLYLALSQCLSLVLAAIGRAYFSYPSK
ncbi:amino acid ABC transporter permease [Yangia mangrovi]|uniref:Glutamate/aspartate import permease protein GltK n=1 Tax=Alloyangia mangrovi TaxID=1779329 RepID=A0A2A3K124_9RHOB|nr:amino acid ABC transporter permease [Alloyangia mangrovi]MCT4370844.1 amino acid ABC transporter permease [Alloyangia mangrovi]